MTKKAMCIGMNYPNSGQNKLTGCVADASSMACLMLDLGIESENISLMIDETNFDKNNYNLMSNENKNKLFDTKTQKWKVNNNDIILPTKKNILKKISDICSDKTVTMLFLSVSSHGTYGRDKYGKEKDGRSEIICALDDKGNLSTNGYLYDYELLNTIQIATNKRSAFPIAIYLVIDICHSGSIANLHNIITLSKSSTKTNILIANDPSDTNNKLNKNVYIALFSGCQDNQLSSENDVALMTRAITIRGYMTRAFEMAIRSYINSVNDFSCFDVYNSIFNNMVRYLNGSQQMNNGNDNQLPNFSTNKNIDYNSKTKTIKTMNFMLGKKLSKNIMLTNKISNKWNISRDNQKIDITEPNDINTNNSVSANSSSNSNGYCCFTF